jgi:hypothetical protein
MSQSSKVPPRRPDWRARLVSYLALASGRTFRPGLMDCALFGAGGVEALTGFDPAADLRGKYRSIEGGYRALKAQGFASHTDFAASLLEPIHPAFAQAGDLAVLPGDGGDALGIFQGPSVYCLGLSGLVCVSRLNVKGAFKV